MMNAVVLALATLTGTIFPVSATPSLAQSDTAAAAAAANILCNQIGWDAGRESIMSTTEGSYPTCSAACFQYSWCKSFAYTGNTWRFGDCQLYDVAVSKNFVADSSSPYYFYDIGCEKVQKVCNKNGHFIGNPDGVIWAADTYSDPPSQQTYSYCYNECKNEPSCRSFAWNKVLCEQYDVPLSGNFNETWDSDTTIFYYDLSCGDLSSSTTTSTTKTKTTTTTTTNTVRTSTKPTTTTTSIIKTTTTTVGTKPSTTTTIKTTTTTTTRVATTTTTSRRTSSSPSASKAASITTQRSM